MQNNKRPNIDETAINLLLSESIFKVNILNLKKKYFDNLLIPIINKFSIVIINTIFILIIINE